MPPMRLGQIIEFLLARIDTPGRNGMQKRFPEMCPLSFDESYIRTFFLAERISKARGKFEAARSSTDNYDFVEARGPVLRRSINRGGVISLNCAGSALGIHARLHKN